MSCGVGRRLIWDPELLWLWCRPVAATLIQPLAWELPYAMSVALKAKREKKEKKLQGHFLDSMVWIYLVPSPSFRNFKLQKVNGSSPPSLSPGSLLIPALDWEPLC